jgi:predicted ArsR family transcriptional regulator
VRRGGGGGKPAYVYELTPEAENLFPKGYEPVLRRLLDVLAERLGGMSTPLRWHGSYDLVSCSS